MRFERLRLDAFGPFTGTELDLRGGAPGGVHVIYGPNEAGKSTSLRGVRSFLFGMPHSSVDAHLHPSSKLRVGAQLSRDGLTYDLVRLKRRKDSLVMPDGSPVATDPLPELLGGIDEESFSLRFGLDQAELEKGAEALLGGTEQGLFSAGTAGASVKEVLARIDQEAGELFLPRGKKPLLNRLHAEFEQAQRQLRRSERPPEKWIEQERAHRAALAEQKELSQQRARVRVESRRLSRLRAVMADLASWQSEAARLEQLSDVVELPEDAAERREHWTSLRTEAEVEARRIRQELTEFEKKWEQLPEDSKLADIDDDQLNLGTRVGTARSARADLPKRRAQLLEVERQLGAALRDMGRTPEPGRELEAARRALEGKQAAGAVRRLAASHSGLAQTLSLAERRRRELERQQQELTSTEAPEDLELTEAKLADARAALPLFDEALRLEKEAADAAAEVAQLQAALGFEGDPLADLRALPTVDAVRTAVSRREQDEAQRERLNDQLATLDDRRQALERTLSGQRELPSEEELVAARSERDACLDQVASNPAELGRLARLVARSDQIADRLRSEARAVADRRVTLDKLQEIGSLRDSVHRQLEELAQATDAAERRYREWVSGWGVRRAPEARHAVRLVEQLERLVGQATHHRELSQRVQHLQERVTDARKKLAGDEDEALALPGLVAATERRLREGLAAGERAAVEARRANELANQHRTAVMEEEAARTELSSWATSWDRATTALGLEGEVSVDQASAVLEQLERIERLVDQASNFEGRIRGMMRDTESLAADVQPYAAEFLEKGVGEDPVDVAALLHEAIGAARNHRAERRRVRQLIEERRIALSGVELRVTQAREALDQMMRAAGAEELQELMQKERLSAEKRALSRSIHSTLARIAELAEGVSPHELLTEAAEFDGAVRRLIDRLDELDDEALRLEDRLRIVDADVESMRLGLETYRSQDVAVARQMTADRAAEVRGALHEYLVLRAAHAMLSEQMRSYAEQLSGPIATRAGDMFRRITLGRYQGLSIGLGEKTLRCVRDGEQVEVHQLSRGTRAQLYFVLRLASLEHYFQRNPPLPLVFDDLFVDFDDDRTSAAFELMAEIGEQVQVLYFTHLARDLEKAHDAVPSSRLFSHTIGVV